MRTLRAFLAAPAAALLLAAACQPTTSSDATEVRLRNQTGLALDAVKVVFTNDPVEYGSIPDGGATEYKVAGVAYRYAYIEAMAGGRRLVLQPIDFVGERPLGNGRFTYVLTADPGGGPYLGVRLTRD